MKKTRSCLLIAFLAACLLSGCGEQERAEASTVSGESYRTAAQTELTEDAEPLYSLSEQYRITTIGTVEGNPKVLPELLRTVSADELPKTVPIFADPYPFNQAGAMFEVDDAYREESAAAIERYMRLLFGSDFTLNSVAVEETERRSHYTFGGYTVSGDPTGISLSCEADVSSAESLMKSPAVSAMLVYCGIEKPCVRKRSPTRMETHTDIQLRRPMQMHFKTAWKAVFPMFWRKDASAKGRYGSVGLLLTIPKCMPSERRFRRK